MLPIEPTGAHRLWGAVDVLTFGTPENWSLAGESPEMAEQRNPGIIERMRWMSQGHNCEILAPSPREFNGRIVGPQDLKETWIAWSLFRGALADGVLLTRSRQAFAVSSGDCPTVIIRNALTGEVAAAHAGRDSLIKEGGGLIRQMVESLLRAKGTPCDLRAFIACGIGYHSFTHPLNDPKYGERNRWLHAFACRYEGAASEDDMMGCIHLPSLIIGQLFEQGVSDTSVGFDGVDTYSDADTSGTPHWHSNRRGDETRNLVMVIRRN